MSTSRRSILAAATLLALATAPAPLHAQLLEETGTVATGLLLRQMDGVKRVLMIAAHPDDEDTSLLATLSRGWGAETAYLSLTRGDGGQNLIGSELWEGLGIVRTGELTAARRLDGGSQFFTRAFDYGYSKSADEALALWPRDELVRDVVWVVRSFRPHVIVTVFTGTPNDGHGQHQAAGIVAREAFAASADPGRYSDQLELGVEAWEPLKLYQLSFRRFRPGLEDGSRDVATGVHDPLLGRSLFQLSMESRSQHRSQDMGAPQLLGPRTSGVILEESRVRDVDQAIFSGIDTTLVGLADRLSGTDAAEAGDHLGTYRAAVREAVDDFGLDPERVVPHLTRARGSLDAALALADGVTDPEYHLALSRKSELLDRALLAASGIVFDVRADDELVVPGQTVRVTLQLWNGGSRPLTDARPELAIPPGWTAVAVERTPVGAAVAPGALVAWAYDVAIPSDADPTRLYYLREERDGARYRWPDAPELWGLPRDPEPVQGRVSFALAEAETTSSTAPGGVRFAASDAWRYVGVDPARGEFEEPVLVVPELSVRVAPSGLVWPAERSRPGTLSVVVRTEREGGSTGTVSVNAPAGWLVDPASRAFELGEAGAERAMEFEIRPDGAPEPGRRAFAVRAVTSDGPSFEEGYALVDYEHIERAPLYAPAEAEVSVVSVRVAEGVRVGYVMGSGDDGPEAIRQLGADVELLDAARVREADFSAFSTIVLGVRAYETRPDLQAASAQLLDFARAGGTVIVQYNRAKSRSCAEAAWRSGRVS